jgi:uncharacterized damage-inducible protein DinB
VIQETLLDIFDRDLNKLIAEINLYKDENDLWAIKEGISNSAGNLCLHLMGNLNHFIGAVLGNTGYVREREKEFSDKNIPVKDLIHSIEKTMVVVKESLSKLSAADFEKIFPLEVFGKPLKTDLFMVHLATHLSYHMGQINYHRRLLH